MTDLIRKMLCSANAGMNRLFIPVLLCAFMLSASEKGVYRDRKNGDQAFSRKDYAVAASFYQHYLKDASAKGDINAVRDAYEHTIDALILGKMPLEAEKLLSEYELRFPGTNPLSLAMWRADLLTLQNKPSEAVRVIDRILPGLTAEDPRRARALISLATACENEKNYVRAASVYQTLYQSGALPQMNRQLYERMVLCLIAGGDKKQARGALLSMPLSVKPEDRFTEKLLVFYAMISEEGFAHAAAAWNELMEELRKKPDAFSYVVLSLIADSAADAGQLNIAADAYREAFHTAVRKTQSFETLHRLSLILEERGEAQEAAKLAAKSLELFLGKYASPEVKMRIGGIFRKAGDVKNAAAVYMSLAGDPLVPRTIAVKAADSAIYTLINAKKFKEARKEIEIFYKTPQDEEHRTFLLADVLLHEGNPDAAGELLESLALKRKSVREKALYQAALAYKNGKQYEKALSLIAELQKSPFHPEIKAAGIFLKALILLKLEQQQEAAAVFTAYAALKSAQPDRAARALFEAGKIQFHFHKMAEAEKLFDQVRRKYPESSEAPIAGYWRIYCFQTQGAFLKVERETWLLVDKYPESSQAIAALFNLAGYYADSGSAQRASALLDDIYRRVEKSPELCARVYLRKAELEMKSGDYTEALSQLQELTVKFPQTKLVSDAEYLRADIMRLTNRPVEALACYQKVLKLGTDPLTEAAAMGSIGDCHFIQGGKSGSKLDLKEAENAFRAVLQRENLPVSVRIMTLYKLGRTLELSGQDDPALQYYCEALYYLEADSGITVRLWGAKTAEAVIGIAGKRPVRSHIDLGIFAINRLADAGLLDSTTAAQRINKLSRQTVRF